MGVFHMVPNRATHITCVDIIAQVSLNRQSVFLFLDMSTLKLRITIIILPTERPEEVLPAVRTTKN